MLKIINVVGARPNFIKMASLLAAMGKSDKLEAALVHTGQHYGREMADSFFRQLGLPQPEVDLGVGSASHTQQTAQIMQRLEPLLLKERPDLVVVVGDVNSTIACALVAAKLGIKIAHVEAGLRSFDRRMPEEINRLLTDTLADFLFTTEPSANENLRREGIAGEKIFFVGNVMIDTLLQHRQKAAQLPILEELGLSAQSYALLTLHRPSNVDDQVKLGQLLDTLQEVGRQIPIVFPVHPRTRKQIAAFGLEGKLHELDLANPQITKGINSLPPLGYLEFLRLMTQAKLILTDSGGIQEESTVLGVPCLTLRENTERPVTVSEGTNTIVGSNREKILHASLAGDYKSGRLPAKWDGKAAQRLVRILEERLA
jgi:UDP-N-acetylglucosamine 2-epimerase (non-hydrolysing)